MPKDSIKKQKKQPKTPLSEQPIVIPEGCWRGIIELFRLLFATLWIGAVIWLVLHKQVGLAWVIGAGAAAVANFGRGKAALSKAKDRVTRNSQRLGSVAGLLGLFSQIGNNGDGGGDKNE